VLKRAEEDESVRLRDTVCWFLFLNGAGVWEQAVPLPEGSGCFQKKHRREGRCIGGAIDRSYVHHKGNASWMEAVTDVSLDEIISSNFLADSSVPRRYNLRRGGFIVAYRSASFVAS
jgi:hypothetical protein